MGVDKGGIDHGAGAQIDGYNTAGRRREFFSHHANIARGNVLARPDHHPVF
jgi:hypothetical protein